MSNEIQPRNRAERRSTGNRARAAGAALTAGGAALAMGAAWVGTGVQSAGAAAPITVTQPSDTGNTATVGTLSWAIHQANTTAGADTIDFNVLPGTITVTGDLPQITQDVTITGPGATVLEIRGDDTHSLFDFQGAGTSTISGLKITHGLAAPHGGAINSNTTDLTVDGIVASDNVAPQDGGGLSAYDGGSITVRNSTISGNTAHDDGGGAGFYDVDVSVQNSQITGNVANGNNYNDGGGLYVYGSENEGGDHTVVIDGSTISDNHVTDNGGGVYVTMTKGVTISNSTISGNTAQSLSGDHGGGGVMLDDLYGDASITNTVINGDNTAPAGGGVYVEDLFGNLTLTGSTVSGNEATGYSGGGLYLDFVTGNVTISTTTIADNSAAETGGGVSVETGDRGGGAVSVSNSTISGNDAGSAGGGWFEAYTGGQTSFFNSTVSGNTAADSGGGIWFYGYHGLALVQTTIADNTAPDGAGVFIPTPYQSGGGAVAAHARTKTTAAQVNSKAATKGKGARAEKVHTRAAPVHAAALDEVSATGTIIAGNHGSDVAESGSLSASHSLIGTIVGTTLVDQGGNKLGVDPMLGALANNGGPTMTMELLVGSPAINAGPDPVPAFAGNEFDQRGAGYPRVSGGTVDIGAFEVQPVAVEIVPKFTG